jgi:DnaD/phage-associated family protein
MKQFAGFPARSSYISLPAIFFSQLLPQIDDLAEMKVSLHLFGLLYRRKGYPRFATLEELLADRTLLTGLASGHRSCEQALRDGLGRAVSRGTLLRLDLERNGKQEELYFINTEQDRRAVARIESGELPLGPAYVGLPRQPEPQPLRNIFQLYEENIGVITPKLAEELKDAEKTYPASWLEEAFQEAVRQNKRRWSYVEAILKRWSEEGKDEGKPQRHYKGEIDPEEYFKGRYGHLVRR